jgi:hypothetical protein
MSGHRGWRAADVCTGVTAHVEAGQAWLVDVRVKTFSSETANRLGFLHREFGFVGPVTVPDETSPYPLLRRVRFERPDLAAEISLVIWYMGEEYVAADLVAEDESGSVRRTETGRGAAHAGYEMRHALDLQAQAVRRALGGHAPANPS